MMIEPRLVLPLEVGARLEKSVFRGRTGGSQSINIDGNPNTLYDNGVAVSNNEFQTYNHSETEWALSGGLNYRFNEEYAVFGRFSRGFHMPDLDAFRGGPADPPTTTVLQGEFGVKVSNPNFGLFATFFWSQLLDQQFTAQAGENNASVGFTADTQTPGVEIEFNQKYQNLTTSITATLQDPNFAVETVGQETVVDVGDSRIQRQPRYLVSVNPRYKFGIITAGVEFRAIDSRFTNAANNALELPAYNEINASLAASDGPVTVKLTGSNLTNALGLTEGNPRTGIASGGDVGSLFQARPILGRRFNLSLQYQF